MACLFDSVREGKRITGRDQVLYPKEKVWGDLKSSIFPVSNEGDLRENDCMQHLQVLKFLIIEVFYRAEIPCLSDW